MTSHFRELHRLYADCLAVDDVDGAYSIDEANDVKRIFANHAMLASAPTSSSAATVTTAAAAAVTAVTAAAAAASTHSSSSGGVGFGPAHELDALRRVCNALLLWRRAQTQQRKEEDAAAAAATQHDDEVDDDGDDEDEDDKEAAVASDAASREGHLACVDELRDESEVRLSWKFLVACVREGGAVAVMQSTLARAVVDYHYATARPQQLDMFVHLSATEMFFIDGDALLMAALSSPHVDWDCMQPLHVLYNAQQLLRRLAVCGGRFHVIFFDDAAWVWSRAPQKRFVREELRLTLTAAAAAAASSSSSSAATAEGGVLPPLHVYTFASFHCEAFAQHLTRYSPEFMLVSDGEQLGTPTWLHRLFHNPPSSRQQQQQQGAGDDDTHLALPTTSSSAAAAVTADAGNSTAAYVVQRPYRSLLDDAALGDEAAFYFRCMHLWLAAHRITVAYASRIIAKENAIIVFAVTANSNRTARAMLVEEQVTALAVAHERKHSSSSSSSGGGGDAAEGAELYAVPTLSPATLALASDEEVSLREAIVNAAVHAFLSSRNRDGTPRTPQQRQLCIALVAAAYCTPMLTARERAQPAATAPALTAFLNEMACFMLAVLRHCGVGGGRGDEYDVYDGHVLAALVHHLRRTPLSQLLDEDSEYDVNYTWSSIVRDLNEDKNDNADSAGNEADDDMVTVTREALRELPTVQFAAPPPPMTHECVSHALVDRLERAFAARRHTPDAEGQKEQGGGDDETTTAAAAALAPYPTGYGDANKLRGWLLSMPFDTLNDVVDSYVEAKKRSSMTEREQRQAEKMEANYMQDAKEQAESMGLRGFTTEALLCVRSDSDADDAEQDSDGDDDDDNDDNDDDDKRKKTKKKSGGAAEESDHDGDAEDEADVGATRKAKNKKTAATTAGAAAATAANARKAHAGQRNKKTRSKEDVIREEANLRDAYTRTHDMANSVAALLRDTDHLTVTNVSVDVRAAHVATLSAALSKMTQSSLARKFEASEVAVDAASTAAAAAAAAANAADEDKRPLPLRLALWRALVEASGMREAEFAMTLDEPKASASAAASAVGGRGGKTTQAPQLYGVILARQLVARHVSAGSSSSSGSGGSGGGKGSRGAGKAAATTAAAASSSSSSWGPLERLRLVKRDLSADEVTSYLTSVYLSYIQLHMQLRVMARITKLHLDTWRGERERARVASEAPDVAPGITLFMYCHYHILAAVRDRGVAMAADDLDLVRSALAHFDFPSAYYEKLDRAVAGWQGRPLAPLPPSLRPQHRVCVHTPERMQLLHMGHLLERPVIATRDPRVVFNPDDWQRELLDIVDRRGSAVVCAPTSAGKTFISYYCMYNALRTSNRKVVVYIAPIRALINQAVVDVLARYGSKTYMSSGKNVCGVHGGDNYHRYLRNSQVLVTLPEVLEKMLLSPLYKDWVKNLDYAILDEIHTMESSGNGDVWERVLALLPCPFIALSATLGETRELCGWLNRVQDRLQQQQQQQQQPSSPSSLSQQQQQQQGTTGSGAAVVASGNRRLRRAHRRREYVVHEIPRPGRSIQRWNDIKKYIYMPPLAYNPPLKKLTLPYEARHIKDLHPLSVLTLEQLQRGFPPDITLVPGEVVQLYTRMCDGFAATVWPRWSHVAIVQHMHAQLDALLPERYFAAVNYITQQHARAYEVDVKNAFVYWVYLAQPGSTADGLDALAATARTELHADMAAVARSILASFAAHLREEEQALGHAAARSARVQQLDNDDGDDVAAATTPGGDGSNDDDDDKKDGDAHTTTVTSDNNNKSGGSSSTTTTTTTTPVFFPDSAQFVQANILHVLRELKSRDMGPTIVFSFETEDCNDVAETVITALERAEAAYRQTDEFARYVAAMKRKAAAVVAARKQKESTLKQKRLTVDDDGNVERNERAMDDDGDVSGSEESYEVPEVLPEFTFITANRLVEPATVAKALQACRKLNDKLAVRAIQRGIGIHHAGVKGKVRRQMEILFRGRHCGVVFATETLALGVHSPCRSVVLAGDHVLLNTTQFRQMMGRAGRRGLDYLGHLVFLSVSLRKITRLMTSGMTVIKGNVQCDPLTQLRLLQLHDHAEHRDNTSATPACRAHAAAAAERLLVNPLFFAGRAGVEGGDLAPLTVALFRALLPVFHAGGLHFSDRPSSLGSLLIDVLTVFADVRVGAEAFALTSMLTRGVFQRARLHRRVAHLDSGVYAVSRSPFKGPYQVLWRQPCNEAVAELLAYLFSRHRMCGVPLEAHRSVLSDPVVQALWRRGATSARQHRVVLAPLRLLCPRDAAAFDNTAVLRRLSAFYGAMATRLREAAEHSLPYMTPRARKKASPIFAKPKNTAAAADDDDDNGGNASGLPLARRLRASAVPYRARHPLVAISGCGDYFIDSEDLTSTLRNGLYCDRQMLPLLDLTDGCRHDGAQVLINACVADFVRCHAQFNSARSSYRFTLLEELNGLSQSESYAVLNYAERLLSALAGLMRDKKYDHLQTLEALFPNTNDLAAYAGAPAVLNFAHCLKELRSQIDQHQQVLVRKSDNMSERAGAVEADGRAAAASDDDNDF